MNKAPGFRRGPFALYCDPEHDIIPQHDDPRGSSTTCWGPPMRSTCRVLRFYFVCYFTGCCEEGFEQPVPAVLRPGGQKQSCGLFLGRGSANPSWPTNAQHLPGAAFFILYGRAGVHARRKTSGTARSRFARCLSRIVGAACMRPVKRCTHRPFTVRHGVYLTW